MNIPATYYTPSGRTPILGLLLMITLGVLAGAVLSVAYILAIHYIPFIYVNFMATLFFGIGVGKVLEKAVRFGHLRSPFKTILTALLVGLACVWLQWVFFFAFFVSKGGGHPLAEVYLHYLSNPAALWDAMVTLSAKGHWGIGKSGGAVSGPLLIGVWIIEAGIISLLPAWYVRTAARAPYSEKTRRWAKEEVLEPQFAQSEEPRAFREALETGNFDLLEPAASGAAYMATTLYHAPDDTECLFLTLTNVTTTTNSKGEEETETEEVVSYLHITPETAQWLRDWVVEEPETASTEEAKA